MKCRNVVYLVVGIVILAVLIVGCNGVWMSPKYSDLLDRTASVSAEMANRANADELSSDDMKAALNSQAETWKLFQNARNGKGGDK